MHFIACETQEERIDMCIHYLTKWSHDCTANRRLCSWLKGITYRLVKEGTEVCIISQFSDYIERDTCIPIIFISVIIIIDGIIIVIITLYFDFIAVSFFSFISICFIFHH